MSKFNTLKNDCFALSNREDWTSVTQALQLLRSNLKSVVGREILPVGECIGRIVAENVFARRAHPPADNSAVDGYGFGGGISAGMHTLKLSVGRSAAGDPFEGIVRKGHALRIFTGALIPPGVETVVMQEDILLEKDTISVKGPLKLGSNIREAGEDISEGSIVLRTGHKINAQDLGLLVSVGVQELCVCRRLRVGVLSTGDELCAVTSKAQESEVFDANRPMLMGALNRIGYQVIDLGNAGDKPELVRDALNYAASRVDAIIASGGASVGDEDHVARLIKKEGTMHSWKIAIKPGRPLALGMWYGIPFFGLPGNPVAAFICTLVFAVPSLSVLSGGHWLKPRALLLPAGFSKKKKLGRREYLRARLEDDGCLRVFPSEGSGRISSLSWSNGLIEFSDSETKIVEGNKVRFLPYSSFGL